MKGNVNYGVSALQALWLVFPLQRISLNPVSTRTLLSFKYIHSRIVFMFAWWGQRAKICWTSSLHAHVCLSLSLNWRVLPCPSILLGAGLDAGNSAVRLSCIALPTLSCHVTVFALHLPLPVSVRLSLSPRQQGLQLYTVITLSFCRSSALVASRRASRRHRSCILHARLEKYCDSFRRWKHTRMLMMRSQLWQVRENRAE